MNKYLFLILPLFVFFTFAPFVFASANEIGEVPKIVSIANDEVVDKDFYTAVGEIVEISGTINGDLYAAGGQVLIDGVINGDLIAAGGTLILSGQVAQDARIAAGQVTINGSVGRNLTVVGGNIEISKGANINGALLGAGGNLSIFTPILGDVRIGAGNLTVSDKITGNLEAYVGNLRLTSNAIVDGDLTYMQDTVSAIDSNATVSGKIIQKKTPMAVDDIQKEFTVPKIEELGKLLAGIKVVSLIIGYFSSLIVGLLMVYLFPNYMKSTASTVSKKTWNVLLVGLMVPIAVLLISMVLLVTVVAIPIGLILLVLLPIYIYLAKVVVAYFIGSKLAEKYNWKTGIYMQYIIGISIVYLIFLVPILRTFAKIVIFFTGVGAALIADREFYKEAKSRNLV